MGMWDFCVWVHFCFCWVFWNWKFDIMSPLVDKSYMFFVYGLQSQATRLLRVWFFFFFPSLNSCLAAWEM